MSTFPSRKELMTHSHLLAVWKEAKLLLIRAGRFHWRVRGQKKCHSETLLQILILLKLIEDPNKFQPYIICTPSKKNPEVQLSMGHSHIENKLSLKKKAKERSLSKVSRPGKMLCFIFIRSKDN